MKEIIRLWSIVNFDVLASALSNIILEHCSTVLNKNHEALTITKNKKKHLPENEDISDSLTSYFT